MVANFAKSIPDMKFDIKEVLVAGDRVIVRGEVTGTPAGELFGVPHTGKSFRIMAIDIQTIKDGKIAKTYHMENWLSALGSTARQVMREEALLQEEIGLADQRHRHEPQARPGARCDPQGAGAVSRKR